MKIIKLVLFIILAMLVASCASHTPEEIEAKNRQRIEQRNRLANMVVTTMENVQGCQSIGEVDAYSHMFRISIAKAKRAVKARAARKGATHIVWTSVQSFSETYVSAMAFKCDK